VNKLLCLILISLTLSFFSVRAQATTVECEQCGLDGWKRSQNGHYLIYTPTDLPAGKIVICIVAGPYELNGLTLKEWFSNTSTVIQDTLGKPLQKWVVKQDHENWYVSNSFMHKTGGKMSVGYQGGMLDHKRAYISSMVSHSNYDLIIKYGLSFQDVLNDAKSYFSGTPSINSAVATSVKKDIALKERPSTPQKTDKDKHGAIQVAPGKGAKLSDIEVVWVHDDIDLIWGGIDVDTYLLFKNGTIYKDCVIPPDQLNIMVSKQIEPEKWSVWRKHGRGYQIKEKGTWIQLKGEPGGAPNPGSRIAGKYMTGGGSQYKGAWKNTIQFTKDGGFEMSSWSMNSNSELMEGDLSPAPLVTAMSYSDKHGTSSSASIIGNQVGGGSSSQLNDGSKNTGRYELRDYAITFIHNNGQKRTEFFIYEDQKDTKSFVLGGEIYYIDE
jgi:hypothetical protein